MKSNDKLETETTEFINTLKVLVKKAQVEILDELYERFLKDPYNITVKQIINELKEELK